MLLPGDSAGDAGGTGAGRVGEGRGGAVDELERALRRMELLHRRHLATTRPRSRALRTGQSVRLPNTAVPIRTTVAPSATASSRSPLMPIERPVAPSVPGAPEATRSSRNDRSRA